MTPTSPRDQEDLPGYDFEAQEARERARLDVEARERARLDVEARERARLDVKRCPRCDREMEHVEGDPEVGIEGCWFCTHCEQTFDDNDDYDESDLDESIRP